MEKACDTIILLMESYGSGITIENKNNLILQFCKSFVELVVVINPNSQNKCQYVFNNNINLKNKTTLNAHLLIAKDYAIHVIKEIENDFEKSFSIQHVSIAFDYYQLLKGIEVCYKGFTFKGNGGTRNMEVDSHTAYEAAKQLFTIYEKPSYCLGAYAIFGIRQALELGSKEVIGLDKIISRNGEVFKYGSQMPWDFLAMSHPHPYLRLGFDPQKMFLVNKWAHSFVHTGKNSFCFTVFLALQIASKLYTKIKCVSSDGSREFYYYTLILNYDKLKQSFESYLRLIHGSKIQNAKWLSSPKLASILYIHDSIIQNDFSRFPLFPKLPIKRGFANIGRKVLHSPSNNF